MASMNKEFAELLGAPKQEAAAHEQSLSANGAYKGSMADTIKQGMNMRIRGEQYSDALEDNRNTPATFTETETRIVERTPGPNLDYR